MIRRVCVYCASSDQVDPAYHAAARRLGELLAEAGIELVYGGGARGSMGALADGALSRRGRVTGIIPKFMDDLEWGHREISELRVVEDMHERKHRMLIDSDAVVALPGGCGTYEELFEAITFKRLALFFGPIVLLNQNGYFEPCLALLNQCIEQHFMNPRHGDMWSVVATPEEVIPAIENAPPWGEDARSFAVARRAADAR